jgi:CheY-like chemotaxis protein
MNSDAHMVLGHNDSPMALLRAIRCAFRTALADAVAQCDLGPIAGDYVAREMIGMADTHAPDQPLVLLASDEPRLLQFIRIFCEKSDYRVEATDQVATALGMARDLRPDVIVLALWRELLLEALRGLRSDPATLVTPIVVLSPLAADDPRLALCRELADAYVQMPLDPADVRHHIDRLLRRMSPDESADLAAWRCLRFSDGPSPEEVAAYLGAGHYPVVGTEARALLREMGANALPALIRVLNEAADPEAWQAALWLIVGLAEAPTRECKEAVAAMAGLLSHPDRERRWHALGQLGGQCVRVPGALAAVVDKGAPAMAEVMAALDGGERELQTAAIEVLERLHTPEALIALRGFLPRADDRQRERIEAHLGCS